MVNDSLNYIEQWLATNAPRILNESLNSGATAAQLKTLEIAVGKSLPEDYKDLYRRHNGLKEETENLGSFFYGMSFLPLTEVLMAVEHHKQHETKPIPLKKAATALNPHNQENPLWLKLGFDGSHTWLIVDLDPGELGSYGQVIFLDEEYETAFLVADSVTELLAIFAQDLSMGLYQLNPDAADDGEDYIDPSASIDLVNWYSAQRWQHAADK